MKFEIGDVHSLIRSLRIIEEDTERFLDGDARSFRALTNNVIDITDNIFLDSAACRAIQPLLTYYKGIIRGNGYTITSSAEMVTPLFTSLYYATVDNLTLDSISGTAGVILARDANECVFNDIDIVGEIVVTRISGYLVDSSFGSEFSRCKANLNLTGYPSLVEGEEGAKESVQEYLGFLVGSDARSLFSECTVRGSAKVDKCIGGFVGSASGTAFYECKAEDLTLSGSREIAAFVSYIKGETYIVDSSITGTTVSGSVYLGLVSSRVHGHLHLEGMKIKNSSVRPSSTSASYAGAIASEVNNLTCESVEVSKVLVEANFILAGLTPHLDKAKIVDSSFNIDLVCLGNKFIESNCYELVRDRYAGMTGGRIDVEQTGVTATVDINIVSSGGKMKPFKEEWY